MYRFPCPRCGVLRMMSTADWDNQVQCEQPRCGHLFRAPRAPLPLRAGFVPPPATPQRGPRETTLTGPHVCFTCDGELNQPVGWRRGARVRHRRQATDGEPAGEECTISVYAAIYYCPTCPPRQTLLETPSRLCGRGQTANCPACHGTFEAPWYDLLHEIAGDHCEGEVFRFHCPACDGLLQCDTTRNGRPTAGQPVACLHCSAHISVPHIGVSALPNTPQVATEWHFDGLAQRYRRCPNMHCGHLVLLPLDPHQPGQCPMCDSLVPQLRREG